MGITRKALGILLPPRPRQVGWRGFVRRSAYTTPTAVYVDVRGSLQASGAGVTTFSYSGLTPHVNLVNPAIVFQVVYSSNAISGQSATWGGVSCTLLATQSNPSTGDPHTCELWGIVNPALGSGNNFVLNWTGAAQVEVCGISLVNVSQAGGSASFPNASGALDSSGGAGSNPAAVTIASAVGNWTAGCFSCGSTISKVSGYQEFNSGLGGFLTAGTDQPGASSVTLSATMTATDNWTAVGTDIQLAGVSSGPTLWQGSSTFSGAGSLVASATLLEAGAATFNGAGTLLTSAILSELVTATFNGAGSLVVNGLQQSIDSGSDVFSGAGNFIASATLIEVDTSVFAGAGSLIIDAIPEMIDLGADIFAGAGLLIVNATVLPGGSGPSATFLGSGSFVTAATLLEVDAASFAGAGALTANSAQLEASSAIFSGAGVFTANSSVLRAGSASFAGAGAVTTSARLLEVDTATFSGAGAFTASASTVAAASAIFSGSGLFVSQALSRPNLYAVLSVSSLFTVDTVRVVGNPIPYPGEIIGSDIPPVVSGQPGDTTTNIGGTTPPAIGGQPTMEPSISGNTIYPVIIGEGVD